MKFCPCFVHFLSDWDKIQYEEVHTNLLHDCEFCENQCSECHTWLGSISEFTSVLSTLLSNFGEIWYEVSKHNATEHSQLSATLVQERPHFSHKCIWKKIYLHTNFLLGVSPCHSTSISHLCKVWQHFIISIITVMVITSMGRLPVLYIPKHHHVILFLPPSEKINPGTLWVKTKNSEWLVKQHFEKLCLIGQIFRSRRNEWYIQEWWIEVSLYKFFKSTNAKICKLTFIHITMT